MPRTFRALIIDDSSFMRQVIRQALDAYGVQVQAEAFDVKSGLEAFNACQPDVVIMDMVMPGGSGLDLLKHIAASKPDVSVIIVTSLAQDRLDQEFSRLVARAIINKPFTDEDIKTALKSVFPDHSFDGKSAVAGASPAVPEAAVSISMRQMAALELFFQGVPDRSAEQMTRWCKATWDLDLIMYRAPSKQPFDLILQRLLLAKAVSVQITLRQSVKIVGLALLPLASVENMAAAVARKRPETLSQSEIDLLLTEWANVVIASVVNLFANKMGTILLGSSPEILKLNAEEILDWIPKTLGDKPDKLSAVLSQYSCGSLAATCETLFFLTTDCLPGVNS